MVYLLVTSYNNESFNLWICNTAISIKREILKLATWEVAVLPPDQLPCVTMKISHMFGQCSSFAAVHRGGPCPVLCTFLLLTLHTHSSYVLFISPFSCCLSASIRIVLSWVNELNQFSKKSINCQNRWEPCGQKRERWGKVTKTQTIQLPWYFLVNSQD